MITSCATVKSRTQGLRSRPDGGLSLTGEQVASWWDYGYQTTAMANRTVIVDNNTWNNTHIATVGRAMSSPERKAWHIYRSLDVDYVLVVFGGFIGWVDVCVLVYAHRSVCACMCAHMCAQLLCTTAVIDMTFRQARWRPATWSTESAADLEHG